MPWWGWLLLGLGTALAVTALLLRIFRASRRGRRFMALSTRAKIRFGRLLLEDRGVSLPAKLALVILVTYLALPFDLIPDFVPYFGQLDDGLVILLAIGLLLYAVPREQFDAALLRAEREQEIDRIQRARPVGSS